MIDYQKGKIYKVVNDELPDQVYYGSTTRQLSTRLAEHTYTYKNDKSGSVKQLYEVGKPKIFLVKNCPCNNKEELKQYEREVIDANDCINKNKPLQTYKEWEIKNKEYLSIKRKLRYIKKKSQ
jgi:hypothetical protein